MRFHVVCVCVVGGSWVLVDVVASVLCEDIVGCSVDVISMDVWMLGGFLHLADGICLLLCLRRFLVLRSRLCSVTGCLSLGALYQFQAC